MKRFLTVLLAVVMMLSCCGIATAESHPDTWIADREIVIQAYVDDIGYNLPDDLASTPVMQKITELTGITLKVQYTPGDSDEAVMASQLAAGNIPDLILSYLNNSTRPEFQILIKAAKEGMFADLSEYIPASKVYSKYAEEGYLPADAYSNISFRSDLDGVYLMQLAINAVDRSMEYNPQDAYVGGMYIQKAIADELGIDPTTITTQDALYDLMVAIKEHGFTDANGNPVYAIGPKYWGGSVDALGFLTTGYNWGVKDCGDEFNIDAEGNVLHEAETEYVYEKINFVRKLLAEGLMNPEYFTMDSTRAEEVCASKNSAIIGDVHNYVDLIYSSEDWVPLGPLQDMTGSNASVNTGKGGYGVWAISADAKNPEEIFAFMDFLATEEGQLLGEYGVEGVSYNMVDGKPVLTDEVLEHLNNGDNDWLINNVGAAFGGSACYLWDFATTDTDAAARFGESRPGAGSSTTYERSVQIATDYPRTIRQVSGLPASAYMTADEMKMVKAQYDLLDYKEMIVQACYADSDEQVNAIVESFRAQLKSCGIEQFEAYVKAIYEANPSVVCFEVRG